MLRFDLRRDNRLRKRKNPVHIFIALIEDVPNDAAVRAATIAMGRLPKRAGELPFLSFDAPLNGCAAKDII
jgi:hypothetical protein